MKVKSKIFLLIILIMICFPIISMASYEIKLPEYTEAYKRWMELTPEERKETIEPPMYELPDEIKENNNKKRSTENVGSSLSTRYTDNKGKLTVKDQGETETCWAQSAATVFEKNYNKRTGGNINISENYMDLVTSDDVNPNGFFRTINSGGNIHVALAYATNGMGIVTESIATEQMSRWNFSKVNPQYQVDSYETLSGPDQIKEYIYNGGVVSGYTRVDSLYFSSQNIWNNSNLAYYCSNPYVDPNHAITLVGWDDNYTNSAFPGMQGAYLVLNSYGEEFGDNGYYWIFYDDVFIKSYESLGITRVDNIKYDNLYQYDEYGQTTNISINSNKAYVTNVFNRKNSNVEELSEIAIIVPTDESVTIHINADGDNKNVSAATMSFNTGWLEAGYHTIKLPQTIELRNDKFTICVEHPNNYFSAELNDPYGISWMHTATSNYGETYVSTTGEGRWTDLKSMPGLEGYSANACIKAFTTNTNRLAVIPTSDVKLPKYVFDAGYYAEKNQDIVNVFGYDERALVWHFLNAGIYEGRKSSPTFCVAEYVNYNQDLLNVFGHDYMAFYNHYLNFGAAEGRRGSTQFDPFFYRYYYSDLTNFSTIDLLNQYVYNGIYEGRLGRLDEYTDAIVYDPEVYMACNQDLLAVFGNDPYRFKQHWLQFGIDDGRRSSIVYDPKAYKEYNQDLYWAIGNSNRAFFDHFVKYGINEARNSSYVFEIKTYLKYNPEIKNAYGENYKLMYLHFKNFGLDEQRKSSNKFYIKTYIRHNMDLEAVYGPNKKYFCIHYMLYGKDEGRIAI